MAKLYFKYGVMGSSKSAQALITKFNYEELGMRAWLIKPSADRRDGVDRVRSRVGLEQVAEVITPEESVIARWKAADRQGEKTIDVIIADESQFFTEPQIDELRTLVDDYQTPVLCFGLRTDFRTRLFPGSKRLLELADSLSEIKTVCACGSKAVVTARLDGEGRVVTEGAQVLLGGNDSYVAMCHKCWRGKIREQREGGF